LNKVHGFIIRVLHCVENNSHQKDSTNPQKRTHKTGSLPSPKLKNLNFYRVKYGGWYSQKFCVHFSGVSSFGSGDEQFHDSLHSRRTRLPRAK
jgi:hypothetical protein